MINKTSNPKQVVIFVALLFFILIAPSIAGYLPESRGNKKNNNNDNNNTIPSKQFEEETIHYYDPNYLRYKDYIYKDNIKTVMLNKKGWDFSPPLIKYNSNEKLILRFDDLDGGYKSYNYTIIHCDANWKPSKLNPNEYISGFFEANIEDFNHSFNTRVNYTHYHLEFPNANMQPKLPGNYILKVFRDNNKDDVVLTRKFMVYKQEVSISGRARQAKLVSLRDTKQELNFSINTQGYNINDPYRNIKIVIKQNGRWDNVVYNVQPKSVLENTLNYDYESKILFDGSNEFRYFDTKYLKQTTSRIKNIKPRTAYKKVILMNDSQRATQKYTFRHDINGQYYINSKHGHKQHIESDYAKVHFTLSIPKPFSNGNVYLAGDFTDWNYTESNRMRYNYENKAYETSLLLKQGYYNYMYMFLKDGENQGDIAKIEGNHSDTENKYTILVYHRPAGSLFDSLIGIKHFNTHTDD